MLKKDEAMLEKDERIRKHFLTRKRKSKDVKPIMNDLVYLNLSDSSDEENEDVVGDASAIGGINKDFDDGADIYGTAIETLLSLN